MDTPKMEFPKSTAKRVVLGILGGLVLAGVGLLVWSYKGCESCNARKEKLKGAVKGMLTPKQAGLTKTEPAPAEDTSNDATFSYGTHSSSSSHSSAHEGGGYVVEADGTVKLVNNQVNAGQWGGPSDAGVPNASPRATFSYGTHSD